MNRKYSVRDAAWIWKNQPFNDLAFEGMKEENLIPWMYQKTDCWDSSYGGHCGKQSRLMVPDAALWNSSPICAEAMLSVAAPSHD